MADDDDDDDEKPKRAPRNRKPRPPREPLEPGATAASLYMPGTPVDKDGIPISGAPIPESIASKVPLDTESSRTTKRYRDALKEQATTGQNARFDAEDPIKYQLARMKQPHAMVRVKQIFPLPDDGIVPQPISSLPTYEALVAYVKRVHWNGAEARYKWTVYDTHNPTWATGGIELQAPAAPREDTDDMSRKNDPPQPQPPYPPPPGYPPGYYPPPPYAAPPGYPPAPPPGYPPPGYPPPGYPPPGYPPPPPGYYPPPAAAAPPPPPAPPPAPAPAPAPAAAAPPPPPPVYYYPPPPMPPPPAPPPYDPTQIIQMQQQQINELSSKLVDVATRGNLGAQPAAAPAPAPTPAYPYPYPYGGYPYGYYAQPQPQAQPAAAAPAPEAPKPPVDPVEETKRIFTSAGAMFDIAERWTSRFAPRTEAPAPPPKEPSPDEADPYYVKDYPHMRVVSRKDGAKVSMSEVLAHNGDKALEALDGIGERVEGWLDRHQRKMKEERAEQLRLEKEALELKEKEIELKRKDAEVKALNAETVTRVADAQERSVAAAERAGKLQHEG